MQVILERDGVFIIARGIVSWDDSELDASFDEWVEYEERYKDGSYKIVDTNI